MRDEQLNDCCQIQSSVVKGRLKVDFIFLIRLCWLFWLCLLSLPSETRMVCLLLVYMITTNKQQRQQRQERSFARQKGFDTFFKIVTIGDMGVNSNHEVVMFVVCIVL